MSETFEHPEDGIGPEEHTPEPEQHDEPELPQYEPPPHDDFVAGEPVGEAPSDDPPGLPEPGAADAVWHTDRAADDSLRAWLDAEPPALDPPPAFEQRLADDLAAQAARDGKSTDDLVRDVLDRLRRP